MRAQRQRAGLLCDVFRQVGRKDFTQRAGLILRLVIEHRIRIGDDFAHRQRFITEHPDRDLAAGDELLQHHFAVVGTG
jgi:hypothetical protein